MEPRNLATTHIEKIKGHRESFAEKHDHYKYACSVSEEHCCNMR